MSRKQTEIVFFSFVIIAMLLLLAIIHIEILLAIPLYILSMFLAYYAGLMD